MGGYRHATDRWDWKYIAECPNNEADDGIGEHLTFAASATNSEYRPEELIDLEYCPLCGVETDRIISVTPAEVLG